MNDNWRQCWSWKTHQFSLELELFGLEQTLGEQPLAKGIRQVPDSSTEKNQSGSQQKGTASKSDLTHSGSSSGQFSSGAYGGTGQGLDKQSSDKQSSDKQSSDKQSSDKQSSDKQSSDKQSSDKQSSDKQSSDKQSSDKQSSDKQSSGEQGDGSGKKPFLISLSYSGEPPEPPYFTLILGERLWEYRVARGQLNPENRGREQAGAVYAYSPGMRYAPVRLSELEIAASIPQQNRLGKTDAIDYLLTYGTAQTKAELLEFYPLYELELIDNELPELHRITDISHLDEICAICQCLRISEQVIIRTGCSHYFHLPELRRHCDISTTSSDQKAPSCPACNTGLAALADNLAPEKMADTLLKAAARGKALLVWALLEAGADVNARDQQENTALHLATENGHAEVVHLLLLRDDINKDIENQGGFTALDLASMSGQPAMVQHLA